ncbi:MAG: hypothetical protein AAGA80_01535 [Cyanobacteria bacterium P01_F01_bin.143]
MAEKLLDLLTVKVKKFEFITMFRPTHLLVSRSKSTPVQLIKSPEGFFLVTEAEWQEKRQPMFEIHSQRGFFCKGFPLLGYSLQPIKTQARQIKLASVATNA